MQNLRPFSLSDIDNYHYEMVSAQTGPRPSVVRLRDYLEGFDSTLNNRIMDHLHSLPGPRSQVIWHNVWLPQVHDNYPNFDLTFDHDILYDTLFRDLHEYRQHPGVRIERFLCSFNGSPHVSRQILTSALGKTGLFDPETCSKNGTFTSDNIDGYLAEYLTPTQVRFYRKWLTSVDENYNAKTFEFDRWESQRYAHRDNISQLALITTKCFLNLVSESYAHSYQVYVTEKFMFSVLTRGLFLTYGQPGWHHMLRDYYGFKCYDKIFNYSFDLEINPVRRLAQLLAEVKKFQSLSTADWQDLYDMQADEIEFNYDHFMSGGMYRRLQENSGQDLQSVLGGEYYRYLTAYQRNGQSRR